MAHINHANVNQLSGIVKQVISADSIIMRARASSASGGPPAEWPCRLSGLRPPDTNWGRAAAREYLRRRLVSKDAVLSVEYDNLALSSAGAVGTLYLAETDGCLMSVNAELVLAGLALATCHRLAGPEAEARRAKRGVWSGGGCEANKAQLSSPSSLATVAPPAVGQVLTAVLELVEDAAKWRVQLDDPEHSSTLTSFRLYGVAAPSPGEACHEEARFFVEARLLQKRLRLVVCEAAFDSGAAGQLMPPRLRLAGWVPHPSGCISELLVRRGLARHCKEDPPQSASDELIAAAASLADCLRRAEAQAQADGLWLWSVQAAGRFALTNLLTPGRSQQLDGTVVEVGNGDSVVVRPDVQFDSAEVFVRLRLAYVRPTAPPPSASSRPPPRRPLFEVPHLLEARELLRRRLIGRRIVARIVEDGGGALPASVLRIVGEPAGNADPAEELLRAGLASLLLPESAPPALRAAEAQARRRRVGIHDPSAQRPAVVEDLAGRGGHLAAKRLPELTSAASGLAAIVEFVASADRLRVYLPDRAILAGFRLAGVACPQPPPRRGRQTDGGGGGGSGDAGWQAAVRFVKDACLQRDVRLIVSGSDSGGNLIGQLLLPGPDCRSLADVLVERQLAHRLSPSSAGCEVRCAAAAATAPAPDTGASGQQPPQSEMCCISEVKPDGMFFIQLTQQAQQFQQMSAELQAAMQTAAAADGRFDPPASGLFAARYSEDNQWYRARLLRRQHPADPGVTVRFVDFGNDESTSPSRLAPLPGALQSPPMAPFAHACRLAFVRLPDTSGGGAFVNALAESLGANDGRELTTRLLAVECADGGDSGGEPEIWRVSLAQEADGCSSDPAEALIERGCLVVDEAAAASAAASGWWTELLAGYRAKQLTASNARLGVWSSASR